MQLMQAPPRRRRRRRGGASVRTPRAGARPRARRLARRAPPARMRRGAIASADTRRRRSTSCWPSWPTSTTASVSAGRARRRRRLSHPAVRASIRHVIGRHLMTSRRFVHRPAFVVGARAAGAPSCSPRSAHAYDGRGADRIARQLRAAWLLDAVDELVACCRRRAGSRPAPGLGATWPDAGARSRASPSTAGVDGRRRRLLAGLDDGHRGGVATGVAAAVRRARRRDAVAVRRRLPLSKPQPTEARNAFLSILPIGLRGISSTKRISLGHL